MSDQPIDITTTPEVQQPNTLDIKAIDAFLKANPDFDLKTFNFFRPGAVEALKWETADEKPTKATKRAKSKKAAMEQPQAEDQVLAPSQQNTLLPQLKSLQRLVRLTDDVTAAGKLYNAGLHSAVQIASIPEHKFVEQHKGAFLSSGTTDVEQAKAVHLQALARKTQAVHTYVSLLQHNSAHYKAGRFDNLSAATAQNFNHVPSYQDLFGDLDFCTCPDCRSIFSPAAYFVDLMRLQEDYISGGTYPLVDRRPDLWTRELSCDNTNTEIPKLEIVNEVLLNNVLSTSLASSPTALSGITGAVAGAPAYAWFQEKYHVVYKTKETKIYHATFNSDGRLDSGPTCLSGNTQKNPALAVSNDGQKLYCVVTGIDQALYYRDVHGSGFSEVTQLPSSASKLDSAPSLAVCDGKLYVAWKDVNNNNLYYGWLDIEEDGANIEPKKITEATSYYGPSLTVLNDNLYIAWAASSTGQVHYGRLNGTTEIQGTKTITGATTDHTPALTARLGQLVIAYRKSGISNSITYGRLELGSNTLADSSTLAAVSAQAPTWLPPAPGASPSGGLSFLNHVTSEIQIYFFQGASFEALNTTQYPFNLPFNLPLTEIRTYLTQHKQALPQLWQSLLEEKALSAVQQQAINREVLALSPEQWTLYSTPDTDNSKLAQLYGLMANTDPVTTLANLDCFLAQTGLTHDQLDELLFEDLSKIERSGKEKLNNHFFINASNAYCSATALWLNQKAQGSIIKDAIGNKNGTEHGTLAWQEANVPYTSSPKMQCATFNGKDACIEIPYSDALNPDAFTVAFWAKPSKPIKPGVAISTIRLCRRIGNNVGFEVGIHGEKGNVKWTFTLETADGKVKLESTDQVNYNQWTHVAVSYGGSNTAKLYVNGILQGIEKYALLKNKMQNTMSWFIGARKNSAPDSTPQTNYFKGGLMEVAFFDEALSDAAIQELKEGFYKEPIGVNGNQLMHISPVRLDRINRFVRLAQALGWSFTDLDWALRTIGTIVNTAQVGAPIINNAALGYLAWIQTLVQEHKFSVNQACALIGTLKDFGQKDGPTFFDQVFNNANVPNPPQWKDKDGKYNLNWTVPQPGDATTSDTNNIKIQNALAAALKVSQDDLRQMAEQILVAQSITNRELPLTSSTLAVLYRLSQLPALTALTIDECFVALALPGYPKNALTQLASTSPKEAHNQLVALAQFAKWIKTTSFSVYQLQFLLTGKSQQATTQNQLLGQDAIRQFIQEVQKALKPTLMTKAHFVAATKLRMQQFHYRSKYALAAAKHVYSELNKERYIDEKNKVKKVPKQDAIQKIVAEVFIPGTPASDSKVVDLSKELINLLKGNEGKLLTQKDFTTKKQEDFKEKYIPTIATPNDKQCKLINKYVYDQLKGSTHGGPYIEKDKVSKLPTLASMQAIVKGLYPSVTETDAYIVGQGAAFIFLLGPYYRSQQKLTQKDFTIKTGDEKINDLATYIWKALRNEKYINGQGIITEKAIKEEERGLSCLIASILNNACQLQQKTLSHHLASLYNISQELVFALEIWGSLSKGDLAVDQVPSQGEENVQATIQLMEEIFGVAKNPEKKCLERLQAMQPYAQLMTALAFSHNEAQALVDHPEYFGVCYRKGVPQFTVDNIQTLVLFKKLVQTFQDTQNRLLNYLSLASNPTKNSQNSTEDPKKTAAKALHQLTQWNEGQITYLLNKLWPSSAGYATVAGVHQLQVYFSTAQQLHLDIATTCQLNQLKQTDYTSFSNTANALWAGLQKQYKDQPDTLTQIQNILNETKRNALLRLVMHQLKQADKPITTTRDLYNYLLIDVEVSGVVKTSYVREAISAVQLYIHRCLNHLEQGTKVEKDLETWWTWLEHYRVWQANREVFLYPENYIQPELRKDKTPPFEKLAQDLQQADLTNQVQIDTAFRDYMEGFMEVANLEIVGSAAHDQGSGKDATKTICLVGRTRKQPYDYYYRTATFTPDTSISSITDRYQPVQWNSWHKLNIQLQPEGPVSPVYAFGKWYVFWVAQKQTGAHKNKDGTDIKEYTATIHFSYLNFNGQWVAPQTLGSVPLIDADDKHFSLDSYSLSDAIHKPYWDRVYPVFFSSIQTIYVPYCIGGRFKLFTVSEGTLNQGLTTAFRYATSTQLRCDVPQIDSPLPSSSTVNYQYDTLFGNKGNLGFNSLTVLSASVLSAWFKMNESISATTYLLGSTVTIDTSNQLSVGGTNKSIQANEWNHLALPYIQQSVVLSNTSTAAHAPTYAWFQGRYHIVWVDDSSCMHYAALNDDGTMSTPVPIGGVQSGGAPSLAVFNGQLYLAWINTGKEMQYSVLDTANSVPTNVQNVKTISGSQALYSPSLATWKDQLYIVWLEDTGLKYGTLDVELGKIELLDTLVNSDKLKKGYVGQSVAVLGNMLYVAWRQQYRSEPPVTYTTRHSHVDMASGVRSPEPNKTNKSQSRSYPILIAWDSKVYMAWDDIADNNLYYMTISDRDDKKLIQGTQNCNSTAWLPPVPGPNSALNLSWVKLDGHIEIRTIVPAPGSTSNTAYLNGEAFTVTPTTLTGGFELGTNGTNRFQGEMQEVVVYNRTLSADEVQAIYRRKDELQPTVPSTAILPSDAFGSLNQHIPVLGQPGAYIVEGREAEFLALPYTDNDANKKDANKLDCFRLNTTAARALSQQLFQIGIDALLTPNMQQQPEIAFNALGPVPDKIPTANRPTDTIDFTSRSAMSPYYWEIFFHAPFLLAHGLSTQQQFAQARKWYEYVFNPTATQDTVLSSLQAYWPMGEGTGNKIQDASGHSHEGTIHPESTPDWQEAKDFPTGSRQVLNFDGTDDYVEVTYHDTLNGPQFTISLWVKVENIESSKFSAVLCSRSTELKGESVVPKGGYVVEILKGGKWSFTVTNQNEDPKYKYTQVPGPLVEQGKWTHLAATYNGSTANLYVDGTHFYTSTSLSTNSDSETSLRIGNFNVSGSNTKPFSGQIADVRIWNKALSLQQILSPAVTIPNDEYWQFLGLRSLYNPTLRTELTEPWAAEVQKDLTGDSTQQLPEGVQAYWPMREFIGSNNVADTIDNVHTGTAHGVESKQAEDFPGGRREVLYFGKSSYVKVPRSSDLNGNEFTIACWIKPEEPAKPAKEGKPHYCIIHSLEKSGYMLHASHAAAGIGEPILTLWTGETMDFHSSERIEWDMWTHLVATFDGTDAKLYINGTKINEKSVEPYSFKPNTNTDLFIGAASENPKDNDFSGYMADVGIWNRALAEQEVKQFYASYTSSVPGTSSLQLDEYHNDPFDPHAIARLRPIAYQKTMVMHYIDNLLSWGDNLFRQYTIETILEATMLYILAYDLLGEHPTNLGPCELPTPETLDALISKTTNYPVSKEGKQAPKILANLPEFLIHIEQSQANAPATIARDTPHNYIPGNYFGLPENDQFIAYWNKVEQRLYNIRHGLNIKGERQKLALFEPRINPADLVAAVANGAQLGQALGSLQVAVPYYRFAVLIEKARAAAQIVTQFGQSLLAALEKKDAEQLSLLYNSNQQTILSLTMVSKQDQINAAQQSVSALQASLQNANERHKHYTDLISQGLSAQEKDQIKLNIAMISLQTAAIPIRAIATPAYATPSIFGTSNGGMAWGAAVNAGAVVLQDTASLLGTSAGMLATQAGYQRRDEDWTLQQTLAQGDVDQITLQIAAAQYQQRIAEQDLVITEKQLAQEQKIEQFLKDKFTNEQLYQWMVGKLGALYFQSYQTAYALAIQAQQAWQFERGRPQTFIQTGHWDSLHRGLLAGEALQVDLQHMDKAYMDRNVRYLEIEKTISLGQLDPQALLDLKTKGTCTFDLAEKDFDYDYPGHYLRQIKTVSVSLAALIGPYQNIHATLTQTANKVLLQPDDGGVKYLLGKNDTQPDNSILRVDTRANQEVALSQGINDSGLFQLNFNDERYLPFEGTGAVSSWQLDMPKANNAINYDSITDVVLRVQYMALPGGATFQQTVQQNLGEFGGYRLLSMTQEYATAWNGFINSTASDRKLVFSVGPHLLRPNLTGYEVTDVTIMLALTTEGQEITTLPTLTLTPGTGTAFDLTLTKDATTGFVSATKSDLTLDVSTSANWQIAVKTDTGKLIKADNVSNMVVELTYTAKF